MEGDKDKEFEAFDAARAKDRLDQLGRLRLPFPKEAIDLLPKPFSRDARKGKCIPMSDGGNAPNDQDHYCGGYHGLPALHLSYVGHAYVTERLLDADPMWTWEPLAYDAGGMPHLIVTANGDPVAMWIKLTVCGVTRLGVGTVDPGCKDPEKQLISDALRNAAMRFGVAIDMWMKSGEDDVVQDARSASAGAPGGVGPGPVRVGTGIVERQPGVLGTTDAGKIDFPLSGKKNPRHVFDIPITIAATWGDFKQETVGGKGKYKDRTWEWMISGEDRDAVDYLENYLVEKASESWQGLDPALKAKGQTVLPVYQRVLLSYQELLDRREAPSTME